MEGYIYRANAELFHKINEASGHLVKLVTLAPNTNGAMEFIDEVKTRHVFLWDIRRQIMRPLWRP